MNGEADNIRTAEACGDDLALLRRFAERRDAAALEALFRVHSHLLFRTARRFMRNAADAEDAVQTAFMMVVRNAGKHRGGASVKAWLVKILLAVCKMKIRESVRRRNREERAMETVEASSPGEGQGHDLAEQVKTFLEQLPEHYRLPVWLHHCEGMSFDEVATALAIPPATVRSHASRGIAALRARLAEAGMTASLSGIAALLPGMAGENAPASLLDRVGEIARGRGDLAEPFARLRIDRGGLPGPAKAALAVGVLAAAGAAVVTLWPGGAVGPAARADGVVAEWNFNLPAATSDFAVVEGSWRHVTNGGVGGSGCMQTETDFVGTVLKTPIGKLPVLVTYKRALGLPTSPAGYGSLAMWRDFPAPLIYLDDMARTLRMTPPSAVGKFTDWIESRVYVTDRWVATWDNGPQGEPTALFVVTRAPGSPLTWSFRGIQRIDDLTIRRVKPEEVPDVGAYLRAVEKIPAEKRTGKGELPGMPSPETGKPITVQFLAGSVK